MDAGGTPALPAGASAALVWWVGALPRTRETKPPMPDPRLAALVLPGLLTGCASYASADVAEFDRRAPLRLAKPAVREEDPEDAPARADREKIARGLTLEDAYRIAREANPNLAAAGEGVSAARARIREAAVFANPIFSFTRAEVPTQDGPISSDTKPSVHAWDLRASTSTFLLSKDFDLSGKRLARVDAALESARQTEAQYASAALALRMQVRVAFADVLVAERNRDLGREAHEMAQKNLEIVSGRAAGGSALPADSLRAEAEANRADIDLDLAERELLRARRFLASLLAAPESEVGPLAGALPLSRLPGEVGDEKLVAGALERNPDVIAAKRGVLAADANVRLQERSIVPDLTLQLGWNRYFLDQNDSITFGASVPVPIFDQNRGQVMEARALLRQARRQQSAVENETTRAIRDDLRVARVSGERIARFEKEILPKSREAVRLIDLSYQGGNILYLDVIAARQAFNQSRADYVTELSSYEQAIADLERLLAAEVELGAP